MSGRGQRAYANARIRARRAALLGPDALPALRGLGGARALHQGFVALGLDPGDPLAFTRSLYARLGHDHAFVAALHPDRPALFEALVAGHEAHNLALVHRSAVRGLSLERVLPLLRPVGAITPESVGTATDAGERLSTVSVPAWKAPLEATRRAHGEDPLAFELALDRIATRALVDAASEAEDAAPLVLALARDRDLSLLSRGQPAFGLPASAVVAGLCLLTEEHPVKVLTALAEWTPADGPLAGRLPKTLRPSDTFPADWEALVDARARWLGRQCTLSFRRRPFGLSPSVAWLLLREAEVRALIALAEGAGLESAAARVDRKLYASALGAA